MCECHSYSRRSPDFKVRKPRILSLYKHYLLNMYLLVPGFVLRAGNTKMAIGSPLSLWVEIWWWQQQYLHTYNKTYSKLPQQNLPMNEILHTDQMP